MSDARARATQLYDELVVPSGRLAAINSIAADLREAEAGVLEEMAQYFAMQNWGEQAMEYCREQASARRAWKLDAAMTWMTNKPTMPGWYWWRCFAVMTGKQTHCNVVYIQDDDYCRIEGEYISNLGGEWAGPLEPPA